MTVIEYRVVSLLDYYIYASKKTASPQSPALISFDRIAVSIDEIRQTNKLSRETKDDEEAERQVGERREVFRLDTESNCCIQKASARTSSSTRHPAGSGHREIEDRRLFIFIWAAI